MHIIEVDHVSKEFRSRSAVRTLLGRGGLRDLFHRRQAERLTVLKDVSFTVDPGESLGIIGANGSGKSTLLKILAGVTLPTAGHVIVRGRVASLLELGAGFHPLLTGRENVYLNAGLLGLRHADVDKVFDQIVEFSGIAEFIDQPVDTYSSGMYVRIGFAVAVHTNPDIFLVDEVLAVGDEEFQRKCRTKIGELREQSKTIVFVSHDLSIVNTLCDRVILLSKGEMVVRNSPQETINFYLRQIGRAKGIHVFRGGRVEVIASHGRIALFFDGHEVSPPSGFTVSLLCMGQWHDSSLADWEVVESGPDRCKSRGRMAKLPLWMEWDMRIEQDCLTWKVSVECERDTAVDAFEANLHLPKTYEEWFRGGRSGRFPEILPGDLKWLPVTDRDPSYNRAAVLPRKGTFLPPISFRLEHHDPYVAFLLQNTSYEIGSRIIQAGTRVPDVDTPWLKGVHELVTVVADLGATEEGIRAQAAQYGSRCILQAGELAAIFEHGKVHLRFAGDVITKDLALYSAARVGNLWVDSTAFRWGQPCWNGADVEITGESRRFPFRQHWRLSPVDNGIALHITLDAWEPVDIEEYHVSVLIQSDYREWRTDHESGTFPEILSTQMDWRHVNRDYAPGKGIQAWGPARPSITLSADSSVVPFRMTALNTGYPQHARVLQALRVPERDCIRFQPGRHPYFAGTVTVDLAPAR
jgi:ABC-type polysaccharide/polyol phosphate transport system ATPase subunit